MSAKTLIDNLVGLDDAVGLCIDGRRILPALTLIYAGLDIVASLERVPTEGTRAAFVRWVEKYLRPEGTLGCTAMELYAARCGVLHTFSAESDLSRAGRAREILYAWGDADAEVLRAAAAKVGNTTSVVVHFNSLRLLFRAGVEAWWAEVGTDPNRAAEVASRAGKWFMHMSKDVVQQVAGIDGTAV